MRSWGINDAANPLLEDIMAPAYFCALGSPYRRSRKVNLCLGQSLSKRSIAAVVATMEESPIV